MSFYAEAILRATECEPADVAAVEWWMRTENSTLDGLSRAEFDREARIAHQVLRHARVLAERGNQEMRQVLVHLAEMPK